MWFSIRIVSCFEKILRLFVLTHTTPLVGNEQSFSRRNKPLNRNNTTNVLVSWKSSVVPLRMPLLTVINLDFSKRLYRNMLEALLSTTQYCESPFVSRACSEIHTSFWSCNEGGHNYNSNYIYLHSLCKYLNTCSIIVSLFITTRATVTSVSPLGLAVV